MKTIQSILLLSARAVFIVLFLLVCAVAIVPIVAGMFVRNLIRGE